MHATTSGRGRGYDTSNWRARPMPVADSDVKEQSRPTDGPESTPASVSEGRRLYVGSLAYMAKKPDIEKLFEGYQVQVVVHG